MSVTVSLALKNNDSYVFPPWEYEKYFNLHGCFSDEINYKFQYKESHFHYSPIPYRPNIDLFGFWQSMRYWEDYQDIILSKLTPVKTFGIKQNTTSIHARFGDYVGNKAYSQLDMDYYGRAMDLIKSKYYLVFSDDIKKAKKMFKGEQFTFAEGNDPVMDLSLQSSCVNNIIANSSFSWWGAFLNKHPSKIVIAPKVWFGPALEKTHSTQDLIPVDWNQI